MQIHGSFSKTKVQKPAEVDLPLDFSVNVWPRFNGWRVFAEDMVLPCQAARSMSLLPATISSSTSVI